MARVSFVEQEQAHPFIKEVYQRQEEQNAQVLNLLKVMAHCPWIGRNFMRSGNSILVSLPEYDDTGRAVEVINFWA